MPIHSIPLLCRFLPFLLLLSACGTAPIGEGMYQVKAGDTLYSIARNAGRSVGELQRLNQLNDNTIHVGQILNIGMGKPATPALDPVKTKPPATTPAPVSKPKTPAISLVWPNKGPVLRAFNGKSNKGINIGGAAGSPVYAAASGKVIYANQVRGYGKLLIIKHNKDYLTAYAHNRQILAKEGDNVKQGQSVAEMGNTGSDKVMLHFELRFKGVAINPAPYLP
ncbi:peptidoglycan DD-metalloendopeptidase family protein [Iodobacter ciconiae]|uniref:LysM peptidoglycan-binding domain-containing protein n=1 Tax=Iodobacter ciconiae TaxID=2496266 RepID=A0A3S8ZRN8_9NEIS|nr:peptidoglycan DD-metalloendopeptidase family protein [Iodobacter ciconiae]AZN36085.1 LysM peptidoglycan-binding domain-containing protein [Iodobacter ciconiae]